MESVRWALARFAKGSGQTSLKMAFNGWHGLVDQLHRATADAQQQEEVQLQIKRQFEKCLLAFSVSQQRTLRASIFSIWQSAVLAAKERLEAENAKAMEVMSMQRKQYGLALEALSEASQGAVARSMRVALKCRVLLSWCHEVAERKEKIRSLLDSAQGKFKLAHLAFLSGSSAGAFLHIVFAEWKRSIQLSQLKGMEAEIEKVKVMKIKMQDLQKRTLMAFWDSSSKHLLTGSFAGWRNVCQTSKLESEAQLRDKLLKMDLAVKSMSQLCSADSATMRQLSFFAWREVSRKRRQEALAAQGKKLKIDSTLVLLAQSSSKALRRTLFVAWKAAAQAKMTQSAKMLAVTATMAAQRIKSMLVLVWISLRLNAAHFRKEVIDLDRQRAFHAYKKKYEVALTGVARVWDKAVVKASLNSWHTYARAAKAKRDQELQTKTWRSAQAKSAVESLCRRSSSSLMHVIYLGWAQWQRDERLLRIQSEHQKLKGRHEEKRTGMVMAMLGSNLKVLLHSCFGSWMVLVQDEKQLRYSERAHSAISRRQNHMAAACVVSLGKAQRTATLGCCMNGWKLLLEETHRLAITAEQERVKKQHKRQYDQALKVWACSADSSTRRACLHSWHSCAEQQKNQREKEMQERLMKSTHARMALSKFSGATSSALLHTSLLAWRRWSKESQVETIALAHQNLKKKQGKMFGQSLEVMARADAKALKAGVFTVWADICRKEKESKARTMAESIRRSQLSGSSLTRLAERALANLLAVCVPAWRQAITLERLERLQAAERRSQEIQNRQYQVALKGWLNASDVSLQRSVLAAWQRLVEEKKIELEVRKKQKLCDSFVLCWTKSSATAAKKACWDFWTACVADGKTRHSLQLQQKMKTSATAQAAMAKFCKASLTSLLCACFLDWVSELQESRRERIQAELHKMKAKHHEKFSRTLLAVAQADARSVRKSCFASWLAEVREEKRVREELLADATRRSHTAAASVSKLSEASSTAQLRLCFSGWQRVVEMTRWEKLESQRHKASAIHKQQYDRALACWAKSSNSSLQRACLSAWHLLIRDAKALQERERQEKLQRSAGVQAALSLSGEKSSVRLKGIFLAWLRVHQEELLRNFAAARQRLKARHEESTVRLIYSLASASSKAVMLSCVANWHLLAREEKQRKAKAMEEAAAKSAMFRSAMLGLIDANKGGLLRLCFERWRQVIEEDKLKSIEAQQIHVRNRQDQQYNQALVCWAKSTEATLKRAAWTLWILTVQDTKSRRERQRQERIEQAELAKVATMRLVEANSAASLRMSFVAWSRAAQQLLRETIFEEHEKTKQLYLQRYARSFMAMSMASDRSFRASSFAAWKSFWKEEKQNKEALQQKSSMAASALTGVCQANSRALLHLCWSSWCRQVDVSCMEAATEEHRAALSLQQARLGRAMAGWSLGSSRLLKRAYLGRWHLAARNSSLSRISKEKSVNVINAALTSLLEAPSTKQSFLEKYFQIWHRESRSRAQDLQRFSLFCIGSHRFLRQETFDEWRSHVQQMQQERERSQAAEFEKQLRLKALLSSWMNSDLAQQMVWVSNCLAAWCRVVEDSRRCALDKEHHRAVNLKSKRLGTMAMAWSKSGERVQKRSCFAAWSMSTTQLRQRSIRSASAVLLWQKASCKTCWDVWLELVTERRRLCRNEQERNKIYKTASEVLLKVGDAEVLVALKGAWMAWLQELWSLRAESWEEERQASARLLLRYQRGCLACWAQTSRKSLKQRSWAAWLEEVEKAREQQQRTLAERLQRCHTAAQALTQLSSAYDTTRLQSCWAAWLESLNQEKLAAIEVDLHRRYSLALRGWSQASEHSQKKSCIAAWLQQAMAGKALRQLEVRRSLTASFVESKAAEAASTYLLGLAWAEWCSYLEEMHAEAAREQQQRLEKEGKARLAHTLMGWSASSERLLRSNCFTAWLTSARDGRAAMEAQMEDTARKSFLAASAVSGLSQVNAAALARSCWYGWHRCVEIGRREAAELLHRERELKKKTQYGRALLCWAKSMQRALVQSCWASWNLQAADTKQLREEQLMAKVKRFETAAKALTNLSGASTASLLQTCFYSWLRVFQLALQDSIDAERHRAQLRQSKQFDQALACWAQSNARSQRRACLAAWHKAAQDAKLAQQEQIHRSQVAASALLRLGESRLSALLQMVFSAWFRASEESRRETIAAEAIAAEARRKDSAANAAMLRLIESSARTLLQTSWIAWSKDFMSERRRERITEEMKRVERLHKDMYARALRALHLSSEKSLSCSCFSAWLSEVQHSKELRQRQMEESMRSTRFAASALTGLGEASSSSLLQICWITWNRAVEASQRTEAEERMLCLQQAQYQRALAVWQKSLDGNFIKGYFSSWLAAVLTVQQKRAEESQARMQRSELALRAVGQLCQASEANCLQVCLAAWMKAAGDAAREAIKAEKDRLDLLHRQHLRAWLQNSAVSSDRDSKSFFFSAWQKCVVQSQEELRRSATATAALSKFSAATEETLLRMALSSWYRCMQKTQREALRAEQLRLESQHAADQAERRKMESQHKAMYARALQGMGHSSEHTLKVSALDTWSCAVQDVKARKKSELQIARALQRMGHSCERTLKVSALESWSHTMQDTKAKRKSELLVESFGRRIMSFGESHDSFRLQICFGVWSREAQEAGCRARQSEHAAAALASFCKQGRDVLRSASPTRQQTGDATQLLEAPNSKSQSSPRLVEVALKGCAGIEHIQQLQKQAETLAWRCASDIAEMIGDREARFSAGSLPLPGPPFVGHQQISGSGSLGSAAAALAEAYKMETRRLLRVHVRLVQELQPVVDEVYIGMDHVLDDAKKLVSLLMPSSPTAAAPLALTAGVVRSATNTLAHELAADDQHGTIPRRKDPETKRGIVDAFRTLQSALPDLRQRLRKGHAAPEDTSTVTNYAPTTSSTECPSCGNFYMSDSKFCRKCGVERKEPASESSSPRPTAIMPTPLPPSTPRRSPQIRHHKSPQQVSPPQARRPPAPALSAIDAESPATRIWN